MGKAKRAWIGFLTLLCMICCAFGLVACGGGGKSNGNGNSNNEDSYEQATAAEYFTFTLKEDDTYAITAKDKNNLPQSVALPSSYKGKPVTSIGNDAFSDCRSLTSVTIGKGVTSIGDYAFAYCRSLTSVTFKNPNGWKVSTTSSFSSSTTLSSSSLSNSSTAATYLTSTDYYRGYYWKRS